MCRCLFVGINLKQRAGKDLSTKDVFVKAPQLSPLAHVRRESQPSVTKSRKLSTRETRASALRKQAQFKKAASSDTKKTVSFLEI